MEQNRQYEQNQFNDKTHYNEEIQRLKHDYEQEKYEKNQKDKTIEQLNEKVLSEKNQNDKIHSKYDTLQVELLQLREAKNNEPIVIVESSSHPPPPPTRLMRSKRSAHDEVALICFSFLLEFLHFYIGYTR
jgi:chromosome segregation ATPase